MKQPKALKQLRKRHNRVMRLPTLTPLQRAGLVEKFNAEVRRIYAREKAKAAELANAKRQTKAAKIAYRKAQKKRTDVPRRKPGMSWATWYDLYLRCPHWRTTRAAALRRAGHRCESCGAVETLQVHHLTYKRLRRELPTDLKVLCRVCHMETHGLETVDSVTLNYLKLDLGNNSR